MGKDTSDSFSLIDGYLSLSCVCLKWAQSSPWGVKPIMFPPLGISWTKACSPFECDWTKNNRSPSHHLRCKAPQDCATIASKFHETSLTSGWDEAIDFMAIAALIRRHPPWLLSCFRWFAFLVRSRGLFLQLSSLAVQFHLFLSYLFCSFASRHHLLSVGLNFVANYLAHEVLWSLTDRLLFFWPPPASYANFGLSISRNDGRWVKERLVLQRIPQRLLKTSKQM